MKNKLSLLFSLLVVFSMALSACGGAAATEAPAAATSEVTFWHAYGTGSAEEVALTSLLEKAKTDLPNVTINVLQVPFNDIFNKYRTDVAAGGGPDMFIAPNDDLGNDARASLIADITDLAAGKLEGDQSARHRWHDAGWQTLWYSRNREGCCFMVQQVLSAHSSRHHR